LHRLKREKAQTVIESEFNINLKSLPRFGEIDEIRKISNSYKHADGFSGEYKEIAPNAGGLMGYLETRYELDCYKVGQSIQAVREFMFALPGDRQQYPEIRLKSEVLSST